MNERILELMDQCEEEYSTQNYPCWDMEKFAQLIVEECVSAIETAENGYCDYRKQIEDAMRDHCIWVIKSKFGIEK